MTADNGNIDPNDFLEAFKKLQEGEKTADELERKLDIMEEKMSILLSQLETVEKDNENKLQSTSNDSKFQNNNNQ